MRQKYLILYKHAGSNIDSDRTLGSSTAVAEYLPRAILIGLFSPFPAYWFNDGKTYGLGGRLLAGLETGFIYLLTPFALASVWRSRRMIQVWFLLGVVLLGAGALGLVIANMGALYRIRYFFWIVLIILSTSYLTQRFKLNRVIRFIAGSKSENA
jgi:hypothetical protein